MARMNSTTRGAMRTKNHEGHAAYSMGDREKLVTMALTTMLSEEKFYGDNTDELVRLAKSMCAKGDGEFVAKLAVWARTVGNMRSVSHALVAICTRECSGQLDSTGKSYVRKAARKVASVRVDDGPEMLAAYKAMYGKGHPHALERGVRDALELAKPYGIAKYQLVNRDMKLRDALRITHPDAVRRDTTEAMGKCVDGTLDVPKSWETEITKGNTKEAWDELIHEGRLGIFALVRNLRSIVKTGADIDSALKVLYDSDAIKRSRMLPFRFYTAYRTLVNCGMTSAAVARALDNAMLVACENAEQLPGRTAVLVDISGSMNYGLSAKTDTTCRDVAAVLSAMFAHMTEDCHVVGFNNEAHPIPMVGTSILSDISLVPEAYGGTRMEKGFEWLMAHHVDADRVVVLSDNEVNGSMNWWGRNNMDTIQRKLDEYRRMVGHDVWCHAIDMQGYGTQQFAGHHVNVIAGWSEQVLRFVGMAESSDGSLVKEIEALSLD